MQENIRREQESSGGFMSRKDDCVREQKRRLRKLVLARMEALPEDYILRSGEQIVKYLLESRWYREAESVFAYVSIRREPATHLLLEAALADGKTLFVPKCVSKTQMRMVQIRDLSLLAPGMFGIPEPKEPFGEAAPQTVPALCVIPCLAASPDGMRLGHGAGYYDRFLAKKDTLKLCLCYGRLLEAEIPADDRDVRMDFIATEDGITDCR